MRIADGGSIDAGWAYAVDHLMVAPQNRISNLLVVIGDPQVQDRDVERMIDETLELDGHHTMSRIARTIMPESILLAKDWRRSTQRILPSLTSRFYFKRMVAYPTHRGPVNQLLAVIEGLNKRNSHNARLVDPGPIVFPKGDVGPTQQRGFPCLSEIQFHRDGNYLMTTAIYRSQYYDTKAYGNFIGLARLASLVARETHLQVGELAVLATQARLQNVLRIKSVRERLMSRFPPRLKEKA